MTTPIVLSLGELLWDMLPSGKRAGGAPVNFAYHAMKNGTEGWAISAVGEDELGDELIAKADEAGINTVHPAQCLADLHRRSRTEERYPGVHHRQGRGLGSHPVHPPAHRRGLQGRRRLLRHPGPALPRIARHHHGAAQAHQAGRDEVLRHQPARRPLLQGTYRGTPQGGHRLQDQRRGTPAAARHVRHPRHRRHLRRMPPAGSSAAPPAKMLP